MLPYTCESLCYYSSYTCEAMLLYTCEALCYRTPVRLCATTHRTLVRLLAGMPPHVDDQHVLGFERLLLPVAVHPAAHKRLLVCLDVILVDVL